MIQFNIRFQIFIQFDYLINTLPELFIQFNSIIQFNINSEIFNSKVYSKLWKKLFKITPRSQNWENAKNP